MQTQLSRTKRLSLFLKTDFYFRLLTPQLDLHLEKTGNIINGDISISNQHQVQYVGPLLFCIHPDAQESSVKGCILLMEQYPTQILMVTL